MSSSSPSPSPLQSRSPTADPDQSRTGSLNGSLQEDGGGAGSPSSLARSEAGSPEVQDDFTGTQGQGGRSYDASRNMKTATVTPIDHLPGARARIAAGAPERTVAHAQRKPPASHLRAKFRRVLAPQPRVGAMMGQGQQTRPSTGSFVFRHIPLGTGQTARASTTPKTVTIDEATQSLLNQGYSRWNPRTWGRGWTKFPANFQEANRNAYKNSVKVSAFSRLIERVFHKVTKTEDDVVRHALEGGITDKSPSTWSAQRLLNVVRPRRGGAVQDTTNPFPSRARMRAVAAAKDDDDAAKLIAKGGIFLAKTPRTILTPGGPGTSPTATAAHALIKQARTKTGTSAKAVKLPELEDLSDILREEDEAVLRGIDLAAPTSFEGEREVAIDSKSVALKRAISEAIKNQREQERERLKEKGFVGINYYGIENADSADLKSIRALKRDANYFTKLLEQDYAKRVAVKKAEQLMQEDIKVVEQMINLARSDEQRKRLQVRKEAVKIIRQAQIKHIKQMPCNQGGESLTCWPTEFDKEMLQLPITHPNALEKLVFYEQGVALGTKVKDGYVNACAGERTDLSASFACPFVGRKIFTETGGVEFKLSTILAEMPFNDASKTAGKVTVASGYKPEEKLNLDKAKSQMHKLLKGTSFLQEQELSDNADFNYALSKVTFSDLAQKASYEEQLASAVRLFSQSRRYCRIEIDEKSAKLHDVMANKEIRNGLEPRPAKDDFYGSLELLMESGSSEAYGDKPKVSAMLMNHQTKMNFIGGPKGLAKMEEQFIKKFSAANLCGSKDEARRVFAMSIADPFADIALLLKLQEALPDEKDAEKKLPAVLNLLEAQAKITAKEYKLAVLERKKREGEGRVGGDVSMDVVTSVNGEIAIAQQELETLKKQRSSLLISSEVSQIFGENFGENGCKPVLFSPQATEKKSTEKKSREDSKQIIFIKYGSGALLTPQELNEFKSAVVCEILARAGIAKSSTKPAQLSLTEAASKVLEDLKDRKLLLVGNNSFSEDNLLSLCLDGLGNVQGSGLSEKIKSLTQAVDKVRANEAKIPNLRAGYAALVQAYQPPVRAATMAGAAADVGASAGVGVGVGAVAVAGAGAGISTVATTTDVSRSISESIQVLRSLLGKVVQRPVPGAKSRGAASGTVAPDKATEVERGSVPAGARVPSFAERFSSRRTEGSERWADMEDVEIKLGDEPFKIKANRRLYAKSSPEATQELLDAVEVFRAIALNAHLNATAEGIDREFSKQCNALGIGLPKVSDTYSSHVPQQLRERIASIAEDFRAGHAPGTQPARQDEGGAAMGRKHFVPLERRREVSSTSFVSSVRARQAGHGLSFEINPALPEDMKTILTTAKKMVAVSVRETVSTAR